MQMQHFPGSTADRFFLMAHIPAEQPPLGTAVAAAVATAAAQTSPVWPMALGQLPTTANARRIKSIKIKFDQTVAADAVNYATLTFRTVLAGVTVLSWQALSFATGIVAGTDYTIAVPTGTVLPAWNPGEDLAIAKAVTGTGTAIPGFSYTIDVQ